MRQRVRVQSWSATFDICQSEPSEKREHADERQGRERPILEALPHPRGAAIEYEQREREQRKNIRADLRLELLHFAKASE
jgi:hypothetical protein